MGSPNALHFGAQAQNSEGVLRHAGHTAGGALLHFAEAVFAPYSHTPPPADVGRATLATYADGNKLTTPVPTFPEQHPYLAGQAGAEV